jgi:hypothetical protein
MRYAKVTPETDRVRLVGSTAHCRLLLLLSPWLTSRLGDGNYPCLPHRPRPPTTIVQQDPATAVAHRTARGLVSAVAFGVQSTTEQCFELLGFTPTILFHETSPTSTVKDSPSEHDNNIRAQPRDGDPGSQTGVLTSTSCPLYRKPFSLKQP